jgi:diguanylate cyclase (GGDEF)-like protein/PAS domain S-box-containing protein
VKPAKRPDNEPTRLAALQALEVLDTDPEQELDALVRVASVVCGAPISLISLVDADRQWFKANVGLDGATETPRDVAFCAHAILGDEIFEVTDAALDPRFADNPLVTGGPRIRFYAGAPVQLSDGHRVGTLCVIDRAPRQLTPTQREVLSGLATAAAQALEGRHAMLRTQQLAAELAEQHELLRVTLDAIGEAVLTTDAQGLVAWMNPVAERLTGWTSGDACGQPLDAVFSIIGEADRQPVVQLVQKCLSNAQASHSGAHIVLVSRQGQEFGIECSVSPMLHANGVVLGAVTVFRDVTEQRQLLGKISFQATHDALTGLVNRTEFDSRLARALRTARDGGAEHSLMCIDLDRFKLVNDTCGHAAGDKLLKQVADMLREAVRGSDVVARLGGDEFAILLENCAVDKAQKIGQALCDRMDDFRFVHGEQRMRIGTSIGLVTVHAQWETTAALLQAADASCYAAKQSGRNRVHRWLDHDARLQTRSGETCWAPRIEQVLDEDRFALYAQCIEPLSGARFGLHAEVLLRMRGADGQLMPPGAFFPAAERYQLAPRIDRWVLKNALDWLRPRAASKRVRQLSVNLSGQSVGDPEFRRWVVEWLSAAGEDCCRTLCFEISETAAITHLDDAAAFIAGVRALGVRVALDDFGAGTSSFGYLKMLQVDCLKIDGQFIHGLIDHPLDAAAVRCFIDVARVMGIETVAKSVDRPEVLACLREMGVDFAQGFLLHRPAPIDELLRAPGVASSVASLEAA